MAIRRFVFVAAFSLATASAGAEDLVGRVVRVKDGDSVVFQGTGRQFDVRVVEIDAPEARQPFGQHSKETLALLCQGQAAQIAPAKELDRFGRTLGRVSCNGVDVGTHQVRAGMAWVFVQYAPKISPLYGIEQQARNARVGLWADPAPMPPWEWRQVKKLGEVSR